MSLFSFESITVMLHVAHENQYLKCSEFSFEE